MLQYLNFESNIPRPVFFNLISVFYKEINFLFASLRCVITMALEARNRGDITLYDICLVTDFILVEIVTEIDHLIVTNLIL
jgi:hypothetical protein